MNSSQQKNILKRFYPYLGRKKKLIPLALLFSGIAALLNTMPFIFIWLIIRELFGESEEITTAQITLYTWGVGISSILGIVCYFIALTCSHIVAFRVEVRLQKIGMERLFSMPLGFFDNEASGKIRKVINDGASTTHSFLAHQLPDLAGSCVTPLALFVMIISVNWQLGLLTLVPIILGIIVFSTMMNTKGKERMHNYFGSLEEMSNEAVEYVRGIPVVKTFGQSVFSFRKFYDSIVKYKELVTLFAQLWKYKMSFFNVILQTSAFFLIPVAILLFTNNDKPFLVLTDFIFYLIVAPNFMIILMRSMHFRQNIHIAEQSLDRIEKLLDYQLPIISRSGGCSGSDLEFRNVVFRYDGAEENAIDDVSFTVKKGESVALVGASGGGKTTLARLAAGFYDTQNGEVCIGGINVQNITIEELMQKVSFVFQNTRLFSKSLRENLLIGKSDASEEEIECALKRACAREIIDRLPNGLDTVIGTEGIHLSGGEQQRISLARAMLKNAPIVLFDEATAFIDPENEHLIQQAFVEFCQGKTTLMIAHRLSSVQNVNRILVLDHGKIVEEGGHYSLMKQGGIYHRMFREYEQSISWRLRSSGKSNGGVA